MTPLKRSKGGKGLTVSEGKTAILLRFPDAVVAELDRIAKRDDTPRTVVVYRLLARSTTLSKFRTQLENLCHENTGTAAASKNGNSHRGKTRPKSPKKP